MNPQPPDPGFPAARPLTPIEDPGVTLRRAEHWAKQQDRDREWLATQLGVSPSTLSGYFSNRTIPRNVQLLATHIMARPFFSEPLYTFAESELIRQVLAIPENPHHTYPEYARAVIIEKTTCLLDSAHPPLQAVAEDPATYRSAVATDSLGNG
jgi:hypothetical protein